MKKVTFGVVLMASLWSGGAFAADPFLTCTDAANYGYNTTRSMVSASYNRAACNRDLASQYEMFLVAILPEYLAGVQTTPSKSACLFDGSYEGWLDGMSDEYADCADVDGFAGISRRTVAGVAVGLFESLLGSASDYVTPAVVSDVFAYDYSQLELTGVRYECEARMRGGLSGVRPDLVAALVEAVCD